MTTTTEGSFDLVVLGAGNAGQAAASRAREEGWTVAIVESGDVGGTCPLRGCVPKKVLVAAAEALDVIARASAHGIVVGPARLDFAKLIARERTFVDGASASMEKALVAQGIELIHGEARFVGPRSVAVGDRRLEARKILIATGSAPRPLPFPGAELLVTSDDLLVDPDLPRRIVFVGGGVISLEFAHVFARAGAEVTILERGPRLLPALDVPCVDRLVELTRELGVTIEVGVEVLRVEREGGLTITVEQGGARHTIAADRVANSSGRVARTERLDLGRAGITHDGKSLHVDDELRCMGNPAVYVAGDAFAGAPQLSALATHAGGVAVRNLLGVAHESLDLRSIPAVLFAVPSFAHVGLTEEAARKQGRSPKVHENDMREWRAARTYAEKAAFARVIVDEETNELLGAHLLGHGAAETIHAFAAVIRRRGKAAELREQVYAYPTFHSDVRYLVG